MTQREFIDTLKRTLSGQVPPHIISENLNYYENYIYKEMERGRSEADILDELGDPRLLARTIMDAEDFSRQGRQTRNRSSQFDTVYYEEEPETSRPHISRTGSLIIVGVILIMVLVFLFFTFKTVFSLLFSFHGIWFWAIVLLVIYSLSRRR